MSVGYSKTVFSIFQTSAYFVHKLLKYQIGKFCVIRNELNINILKCAIKFALKTILHLYYSYFIILCV